MLFDETATFAFLAEARIFKRHKNSDRITVIRLNKVHLFGGRTSHLKRCLSGGFDKRGRQTLGVGNTAMTTCLTRTKQIDRALWPTFRAVRTCDDECATT